MKIFIHDAKLPMVRVNRDEMNRFIESYKELLAACEAALEFMDDHRMSGGLTYDTIFEAVQKAKGE